MDLLCKFKCFIKFHFYYFACPVATLNQITKKLRFKRTKKTKHLLLRNRPQKRVTCLNQLEMAPRKPNSAKRNIADVFWFQKPKWKLKHQLVKIKVLIPGQAKQVYAEPPVPKSEKRKRLTYPKTNYLPTRKGEQLLIHGATVKDLPRVNYKVIRRHLGKVTLKGLDYRRQSRSKYGTLKQPDIFERKKKRGYFVFKPLRNRPEIKVKIRNFRRYIYKFKRFYYH